MDYFTNQNISFIIIYNGQIHIKDNGSWFWRETNSGKKLLKLLREYFYYLNKNIMVIFLLKLKYFYYGNIKLIISIYYGNIFIT